jgi:GSH-dependent disulfide-bond oxidoreductase
MIELHYWPTPNGWKISIALEELGLPYQVVPVNIGRGEQFEPEFLAISPNNRMPAIVDRAPADGGKPLSVFESGAILLYLADKTGKLCPRDLRGRTEVHEWLMWQMGGLGPMSGQANHFRNYAPEKIAYGIDRYTNEVNRLYGVLDKRLAGREFICGDFSIADCASWPWLLSHERLGQTLAEFPNLRRWYDAMKERPSVRRGIDVGKELRTPGTMDEQAKKILFGQTAKSVSR